MSAGVPSVRNPLSGSGLRADHERMDRICEARAAARLAAIAVLRDDPDLRVILQPGFDSCRFAIGQKVNDPVPFEVADQRPVALPLPPGPVIDADHSRLRYVPGAIGREAAQESVLADAEQEAPSGRLGRTAAEGQGGMADQSLHPRGPPPPGPRGLRAEAFRENREGILAGPSHVRRWQHLAAQGIVPPPFEQTRFIGGAGLPAWSRSLFEEVAQAWRPGVPVVLILPDPRFGNGVLADGGASGDLFLDGRTHIDKALISGASDDRMIARHSAALRYWWAAFGEDLRLLPWTGLMTAHVHLSAGTHWQEGRYAYPAMAAWTGGVGARLEAEDISGLLAPEIVGGFAGFYADRALHPTLAGYVLLARAAAGAPMAQAIAAGHAGDPRGLGMEDRRADADQPGAADQQPVARRHGQQQQPGQRRSHRHRQRPGEGMAVGDHADHRLQQRGGDLEAEGQKSDLPEIQREFGLQHGIECRQQRLHHVVQQVAEADRGEDRIGGARRVARRRRD